jgi:hypothetical protein
LTRYSDKRLAELLAELPPAPEDWVRRAERIPIAKQALYDVLAQADTDADFRASLLDNTKRALDEAGYESDPDMIETLRRRLEMEDERDT